MQHPIVFGARGKEGGIKIFKTDSHMPLVSINSIALSIRLIY